MKEKCSKFANYVCGRLKWLWGKLVKSYKNQCKRWPLKKIVEFFERKYNYKKESQEREWFEVLRQKHALSYARYQADGLRIGNFELMEEINRQLHLETAQKNLKESFKTHIDELSAETKKVRDKSRHSAKNWTKFLNISLSAFAITEIIKTISEWVGVYLGISHDTFIKKISWYGSLEKTGMEEFIHKFDMLENWTAAVSFAVLVIVGLLALKNWLLQIGESEEETESPEHHHH